MNHGNSHIDNNFFRKRRLVRKVWWLNHLWWDDQLVTDKLETLVASSSIKPGTHRHQGFEQKPVVAWFNTTSGCTTTSGWTTSWELMPPSRGL